MPFFIVFQVPDHENAIRCAGRSGRAIRGDSDRLHFLAAETKTPCFFASQKLIGPRRTRDAPETHGAIGAAGDQAFAATCEGDCQHRAGVAQEANPLFAALGFPEAHRAIAARRGDGASIWREGGRGHRVAVAETRGSDTDLGSWG